MVERQMGLVDYASTYAAMQTHNAERTPESADELWLCEHPPVYTLGLAGDTAHVLAAGSTPVVATNRGGQVTFHGPGQVVAYPLVDLRRTGYFVKEYVYRLEEAIIRTLRHFGITGHRVTGAPGIYVRLDDPRGHAALPKTSVLKPNPPGVAGFPALDAINSGVLDPFQGLAKIAALGIKVSRHCTYHGAALNVAMDTTPFTHINPCGYPGLATTDMAQCGAAANWADVAQVLAAKLQAHLAP